MKHPDLRIEYGQFFSHDYGYGRSSRSGRTDRIHLLLFDVYNTTAVCGKSCWDTATTYSSGNVCGDCMAALGVTADDLQTDAEATL